MSYKQKYSHHCFHIALQVNPLKLHSAFLLVKEAQSKWAKPYSCPVFHIYHYMSDIQKLDILMASAIVEIQQIDVILRKDFIFKWNKIRFFIGTNNLF